MMISCRWRILDFRLLPHAGKDTFIITGFEEILQQLEESQVRRILFQLITLFSFRSLCLQSNLRDILIPFDN